MFVSLKESRKNINKSEVSVGIHPPNLSYSHWSYSIEAKILFIASDFDLCPNELK